MNIFHTKKRGFTLIELLVVIAIIGLLSSIVLASLSSARSSARTGDRTETLISLRNALELYYSKHNSYPSTGGTPYLSDNDLEGVSGWTGGLNGGQWIPNLVADKDIGALPHDPNPMAAVAGCDQNNDWWGNPESAFYIYSSNNGSGYELASVCGSEQPIKTSNTFFDTYLVTQGFTDLHTLKMCVGTADCNGGNWGVF